MKVYLAGPITGLTHTESTDWRQEAMDYLIDFGIKGLSPLRGKEYLKGIGVIDDNYDESQNKLAAVMSSQRGIYWRDKFDCNRADALLINLLGAQKVSIGTVMEIAWAAANEIPAVLVIEKEGNIHEHCMIREACPYRVDNLEDALYIITSLLAPSLKA